MPRKGRLIGVWLSYAERRVWRLLACIGRAGKCGHRTVRKKQRAEGNAPKSKGVKIDELKLGIQDTVDDGLTGGRYGSWTVRSCLLVDWYAMILVGSLGLAWLAGWEACNVKQWSMRVCFCTDQVE